MPLRIFKIREFDHQADARLFDALARAAAGGLGDGGEALLLANCDINGADINALLITPRQITLCLFKACGGHILARENGDWLSEGRIIAGGPAGRNPYAQARLSRGRVGRGLSRRLRRDVSEAVSVCMVFANNATIDNQLPPAIGSWLSLSGARHLPAVLPSLARSEEILSPQEVESIPRLLAIEEFGPNDGHSPSANSERQKAGWETTSPVELYGRLQRICTADNIDIKERYRSLRALFRQIVNQGVQDSTLSFDGLFAKLDYLLHEHSVPDKVARLIHDTRSYLNRLTEAPAPTTEQLRRNLPHDIKATAYLVHHLNNRQPIPPSLKALFPQADRNNSWGRFDEDCLRCLVNTWDDNYIYATNEQNGGELKICYGPANPYLTHTNDGDWTYLKDLLWRGATLHLVRLRHEGDVCMPELIIFEPDYLINITTIAGCFESYAESPFVNLVNKLTAQPNTPAILLGNLAGQFLDETVYQQQRPFERSLNDFFQRSGMALLSCPDMASAKERTDFYANAHLQQRNIQHLVDEALPAQVDTYDPKQTILEPTFFSEVLGIQGRMDFFSRSGDGPIIIEQKSGKGDFVPFNSPDFDAKRPKPQEKHIVQLVLYRALCQYQFHMGAELLNNSFLLYSKYEEGLRRMRPRRDLLFRALRLRNRLAWCEIQYARDGLRLLESLTPGKLNQKRLYGRFWEDFIRPKLDSVLTPIQKAPDLERAYYLRFLTFLEREHLLAKTGNKTQDDSGFASLWLDTLDDKKAAGSIYDALTIGTIATSETGVEKVWLNFGQRQSADTSNFRKGDIVILYPYQRGHEPRACRQMVIRATISDIRPESIELTLRNPQTDPRLFQPGADTIWPLFKDRESPTRFRTAADTLWAIEHDLFESSMNALYPAMQSFLTAPPPRRDLILGRREPLTDPSLKPLGSYEDEWATLVEREKQARELFLVIGPPGTGKTSHGLVAILEEQLLEADTNILLMAYTNRAVDEICRQLIDRGIPFLRIGSEATCAPASASHLLASQLRHLDKLSQLGDVIGGARVVCATTATLNASLPLFSLKHFHLAIVDEASQILEPHLIALLSAAHDGQCAIDRFVLIGDHKQLPAVVQQGAKESRVAEPELRAIGLTDCRRSFFERMLGLHAKPGGDYDPRFVYMLTRQGRMHRDIAEFPNRAFYGGRLRMVPLGFQTAASAATSSTNGIDRLLALHRIAFVATEKPEDSPSPKANPVEADMIAATVERIYQRRGVAFDPGRTVGVIVPYRNQIATVRDAIDRKGISQLHDITIDTVERYQGSQRDYIIYGFTVQDPYQLKFLTDNTFEEDGQVIDRKLNVAMTRARLHLLLFGNPRILCLNPLFARLMDYVRQKGGYVETTRENFCKGTFSPKPPRAVETSPKPPSLREAH